MIAEEPRTLPLVVDLDGTVTPTDRDTANSQAAAPYTLKFAMV